MRDKLSHSGFRYDLSYEALQREAGRIYTAAHLTPLEQETYCRAIELVSRMVMLPLPFPISQGKNLPESLLFKLREVLSEINEWQMELSPFRVNYVLERDKNCDVVPFPRNAT